METILKFLVQLIASLLRRTGVIATTAFVLFAGTGTTTVAAADLLEAIPGLAGGVRTHHVSGDGRKVVFSSTGDPTGQNSDGNFEIFIYDIATKQIVQVTNTASQPHFNDNDGPLPNYDATRIVFRSRFNLAGSGELLPGRDLFLATIGYGGASPVVSFRRLTTTNESGPYSYSGNGQFVALASDRNIVGRNPQRMIQVFRINLDPATAIQQLTEETSGIAGSFLWLEVDINYTGDRTVFTTTKDLKDGNPEGNQEIYYVTASGRIGQVTRTPAGVSNRHPRMSHDRVVIFSSNGDMTGGNPDGNQELFTASEDYAAAAQITNSTGGDDTFGGANDQADISDDGSKIVFVSNRDHIPGSNSDGDREVFLANVRTSPFQVTFEQLTATVNPHPGTRIENVYPKIDLQATRIAFNSDLSPAGLAGILYLLSRETAVPNTPVISAFVPGYGGPGVPVTIYGSNFTGTTSVQFGALPASSFQVLSPGRIVAVAPPNVQESAIRVDTPAGSATSTSLFKLEELVVTGTEFSQGMAAYPGVSGKDALVRAFVNVLHGGGVAITEARLTVTGPTGATVMAEPRMYDMLISNPAPGFDETQNINFSVPGSALAEPGQYTFRIHAGSPGQTLVDRTFTKDLAAMRDVVLVVQSVMRHPDEVEWDTLFRNLEQYSRMHPVRAGIGGIRLAADAPGAAGLRVGYVVPPMFSGDDGTALPGARCWSEILDRMNETRIAFNALGHYEPIEFASAMMPRDSLITSSCAVKDCAHIAEVGAFGYGNHPGHASWIHLCGTSNTTLAHEVAHNIGLLPSGAANSMSDDPSHSANSYIEDKQAFHMVRWESVPNIMAAMCSPACGPDDIVFFEDTFNGQPVDYPWLAGQRAASAGGSASISPVQLAFMTSREPVGSDAPASALGRSARSGRRLMITAGTGPDRSINVRGVTDLPPGGFLTAPVPKSPVELILRSEDNKMLRREFLPVSPERAAGKGERTEADQIGSVAAVRPLPEQTRIVEIAFEGKTVFRLQPGPARPKLRLKPVQAAKDRTGRSRKLILAWTGSDPDRDAVWYRVDISRDGKRYQPLVVRTAAEEVAFSTDALPGGKRIRFRVTATDGLNSIEATTPPVDVPEHGPVASITSLSDGDRFREHEPIELRGLAFDLEDGLLGYEANDHDRFTWRLDRKKVIGKGPRLLLKDVPPGGHVITLEVKDSTKRVVLVHRKILVEPDSDRDGRPDALERSRSIRDPFSPYDRGTQTIDYRTWRMTQEPSRTGLQR